MATVNTTDPKPGFVYNADDDTWYPLLGIATQSLDGLTDVIITSPTSGQTVVYNGTNWVNTAETGDISGVTAGTGLSGGGTSGTVTVSIDSTVATLTGTQTLTNKTIDAANNTLTGVVTLTGTQTLTNKTLTTPIISSISNTGTVTLPTSTDTLVGRATTDTLTNKTLTSPAINSATISTPVFVAPEERFNIVASAATGTIAIDALTAGVWYYTSNATANHTLNFRGNGSNTLNSILTTGDAITVLWLNTNGATPYYPNAYQVDGTTSGVTVNWSGGTAPSAGNASGIDAYSFTIVKTANATFRILAAGAVKYA